VQWVYRTWPAKHQITSRSIYTTIQGPILKNKYLTKYIKTFYIPSHKFQFKGEVGIFADRVALISYPDHSAVIISHKIIADTLKTLIQLAIEP
jgi:hypothetical protein